jgi:putative protease
MAAAIEGAHALGQRFYLASNLSRHSDKAHSYRRDLEPVIAIQPESLVMSDPA